MADKVKYQLEYLVRSSTKILYNCLSTPSGLSEWFSDNVNIKNDRYIFIWDGSEETAKLLSIKANEYIKFRWDEDEGEDYYWEMRLKQDALTKEVALIVTDFAIEEELDESKMLWDSQVSSLLQLLGS